MSGHIHAIFDRYTFDWDKRNHVGGSHPGMRSLVNIQINQLRSLTDASNGGFLNGVAFSSNGNDTAIVVAVHFPVEEEDSFDLHGIDNGVDLGFVAALGKIGNAFNQCGHNWQE
jgi:hypothetical protein